MLRAVISLADLCYRWRLLLWLAAGLAVVLIGSGLADGGAGGVGLAGLVLLVWSSFLFALGHFFAGRNWRPPAAGDGVTAHIRWRLVLAGAWLAAVMLVVLAALLGLFTLRALSAF